MKSKLYQTLVLSSVLVSFSASAQDVVDQIIVTGVPSNTTKITSTASVTALSAQEIQDRAPRSTAELFRGLPGIHAESSSGDSNANIKVRGLPISAGGSRYVSFQEDGFPALLVGDIAFATADSFIRIDQTIDSVQSIRGGTSSTMAANAPGGIINLISKTGAEAGGLISSTVGVDYDSTRVDFAYGGSLNDNWTYHAGGFYRRGEGVRDAESDTERGGQIKVTLAGTFDRADVQIHFKHLDDRTPTYLPIPAVYNGGTSFSAVGVDFGDGTLFTNPTDYMNRRGGASSTDGDGFDALMTSLAFVVDYKLSDMWTLGLRHRTAEIEGNFASPFPAEVLTDATGPYARVAYFNTRLNDMGNRFTDLNATGDFGTFSAKVGVAMDDQKIDKDWNFNEYFSRLDGSLAPVNHVFDANNNLAAVNGVYYGNPTWGNCCTRAYDFEIEGTSPYIALFGSVDALTWDVSYRQNSYDVSGWYAEASTQAPQDINGDGVIGTNEQAVNSIDLANKKTVNTTVDFDAWSAGVNYSLNDGLALFANVSEGGSLTAPDRLTGTFTKLTAPDPGDAAPNDEAFYNQVDQYEIGVKFVGDNGSLFVTYFNAEVDEAAAFEATSQKFFSTSFEADGFEIEGDYSMGNFNVAGSLTLTDSEITASTTAAEVGNKPRRQADYIFNISPSYQAEGWNAGLNIFGTDEAYVQNSNDLKFDSYVVVSLFANLDLQENLVLSLNVNNLFDEEGFTEGEEGSAAVGDYVRIRPINGQTTSLTLKYSF